MFEVDLPGAVLGVTRLRFEVNVSRETLRRLEALRRLLSGVRVSVVGFGCCGADGSVRDSRMRSNLRFLDSRL